MRLPSRANSVILIFLLLFNGLLRSWSADCPDCATNAPQKLAPDLSQFPIQPLPGVLTEDREVLESSRTQPGPEQITECLIVKTNPSSAWKTANLNAAVLLGKIIRIYGSQQDGNIKRRVEIVPFGAGRDAIPAVTKFEMNEGSSEGGNVLYERSIESKGGASYLIISDTRSQSPKGFIKLVTARSKGNNSQGNVSELAELECRNLWSEGRFRFPTSQEIALTQAGIGSPFSRVLASKSKFKRKGSLRIRVLANAVDNADPNAISDRVLALQKTLEKCFSTSFDFELISGKFPAGAKPAIADALYPERSNLDVILFNGFEGDPSKILAPIPARLRTKTSPGRTARLTFLDSSTIRDQALIDELSKRIDLKKSRDCSL